MYGLFSQQVSVIIILRLPFCICHHTTISTCIVYYSLYAIYIYIIIYIYIYIYNNTHVACIYTVYIYKIIYI